MPWDKEKLSVMPLLMLMESTPLNQYLVNKILRLMEKSWAGDCFALSGIKSVVDSCPLARGIFFVLNIIYKIQEPI